MQIANLMVPSEKAIRLEYLTVDCMLYKYKKINKIEG